MVPAICPSVPVYRNHISKNAPLFCSVFLANVVGDPVDVVTIAVPAAPKQQPRENMEKDDASGAPAKKSGGPGCSLAEVEAGLSEAVGALKRKADDILTSLVSGHKRLREEADHKIETINRLASAETDLLLVKRERDNVLCQLESLKSDNEIMKTNHKEQTDTMSIEIDKLKCEKLQTESKNTSLEVKLSEHKIHIVKMRSSLMSFATSCGPPE